MGGSSENTPGEFERVTVRNVSVQIIATELTHMDLEKVNILWCYTLCTFIP